MLFKILLFLGLSVTVFANHCLQQVELGKTEATESYGDAMDIFNNILIVGETGDSGGAGGAVYVYSDAVIAGEFELVDTLVSSDPDLNPNDEYGRAVAISSDLTIVVGARSYGPNASKGVAYVFTESGNAWLEQATLLPTSDAQYSEFGHAVEISGDVIFVGCHKDYGGEPTASGSVYIFMETTVGAGNWQETQKLMAFDIAENDKFGSAIGYDGTTLAVAMVGSPSFPGPEALGRVHIYSETTPGLSYTHEATVTADVLGFHSFGTGLALEGNTLVVGAPNEDVSDSDDGAVYIFREVSPTNWNQIAKLFGYGVRFAQFGQDVAIDLPHIVVGGTLNCTVFVFTETSADVFEVLDVRSGLTGSKYGNEVVVRGDMSVTSAPNPNYWAGLAYVFWSEPNDDCVGHACLHGASCVDMYYDYCCECPVAHGGDRCADCLCENGGVCRDDVDTGIGYCDCSETSFSGNLCNKDCYNGFGETFPFTGCNCTGSGASGKFCTSDIDDCESSPCINGGTCFDDGALLFPNHAHEFNCSCPLGYHGATCEISDCISSPCLNDGVCQQATDLVGASGIQCDCNNTYYEGGWCETQIDECLSSPCENDGVCTDLLGDFSCNCDGTGYEGLTCTDDIDDCLSSPCQNDGVCEDRGAQKFRCTCNSFWEGKTCSDDVNDCLLTVNECLNGGACTDDPVNMGDVICDCIIEDGGFTGKYCDIPIEEACVTYSPCRNGGKCILDDVTEQMSCDCTNTGYEGDICDIQVYFSECISSPCLNGGQCYDPSDQQDDFFCDCDNTNIYTGVLCESRACDSMPCQNSGSCINNLGGYSCNCTENFSGAQCNEEDEKVDFSSSSTTLPPSNNGDVVDIGENSGGQGTTEIIIVSSVAIVLVLLALVALGWYFFYKRTRTSSDTRFVMPT